MTTDPEEMRAAIEELKLAQAVQTATQAGAQATQAAATTGAQAAEAAGMAGLMSTMIAGSVALIVGIFTSLGMFVSGRLIDRLAKKSKAAYAWLPALGLAIAAPLFAGFIWADSWQLALVFLALPMGLNYFYLTPAVTLVQEEVKPNQRVMSGALLLLVMNLIGLGLGPTYLGAASDWFRASHPDNSLQMAFYTLLPFYGLAIALFLGLAAKIRRQAAKEV